METGVKVRLYELHGEYNANRKEDRDSYGEKATGDAGEV